LLLGRLFLGSEEFGKEAFTLCLGLFDLVLEVSLLPVERVVMWEKEGEVIGAKRRQVIGEQGRRVRNIP
jgi:hypothetical protein